ncbi:hypothetical protein SI65_06848 [Aspergillus cristatus]|uniref:Uncharacterized protein n=1 Tax=Aspergillus cristatus TaxID=573508 RepID=A0A1E3BAQ5_ASPCR|nr:hypothetical protein SI65_06848 [Aspergillus cristatus]
MDLRHHTIPSSSSISSPAPQRLPHSRSIRLPSSSPPPSASPNPPSDSEGRERKRRRTIRGANSETPEFIDSEEEEPVESIDLTEVDKPSALDKALAKQREDAVKAQHDGESEKGRSLLTAYKCPVCMDTPEDATTTVCARNNARIPPQKVPGGHVLCVGNHWLGRTKQGQREAWFRSNYNSQKEVEPQYQRTCNGVADTGWIYGSLKLLCRRACRLASI